MKKSILLDESKTPDGSSITLHEHDGRYSIRINGSELMSTRQHASEERIAELACAHLAAKRGARVLIGGLGFGFTLRAALKTLPADARVVVSELLGAVIAWNRDPRFPLAGDVLADRRVQLIERDVGDVVQSERTGYDAIILDVDNGPDAMTTAGNSRLYNQEGLFRLQGALRPGGCVAFWSASADPLFAKLMSRSGFVVDVQRARAHTTSGGWHTLFLGRTR